MKSLNIVDTLKYLGEDNYAVSLENAWYRRLLHRIDGDTVRSQRIGRFLDPAPLQFPSLILALANWLPKSSHIVLWIDHFEDGFPSQVRHYSNILGDNLPDDYLVQNPGVLVGPLSPDLLDQLSGTPQQNLEAERLIALCILLCIGNWDAKLIVRGSTDYVEFWEGNIFLHSESAVALGRATELFEFYGLATQIR